MDSVAPPEQLNISLEPHLLDTLRPLIPIAPAELASALTPYICSAPPPTIPYSILQSVSHWARSADQGKFVSQSPPLDPQAYSMISLLAGTTTSPERKFGPYTPIKEPEEVAAERKRERKAITALLNALLSIFGSGFATWWAADKMGWKNEWRVLLGLFAAIIVAVAEAVLYIIWQSGHPESRSSHAKMHHKIAYARHKKHDRPELPATITTSVGELTEGLRRRH